MIFEIMNIIRLVLLCGLALLLSACDTHAINLTANDYSVKEDDSGGSILSIVVSVDGSVGNDIKIPVEIINITTDKNDYEIMQSDIILEKEKSRAVYQIKIRGDKNIEKNEELFVRLNISDFKNIYFNGEKQSGLIKVNILNDDGVGEANIHQQKSAQALNTDNNKPALTLNKLSSSDLHFEYSIPAITSGRILTVGPNGEFALPSQAARHAQDGDVIEIDAKGQYFNDHVKWKKNNLIIKGVNGRPFIKSSGFIKNGKAIWLIQGDNIRITNFEFSGASVRSKNGAAIRLEGENFYLSDCYMHDNENGILTGWNLESEVFITNCEFANNGYGRGHTHNIYIGRIKKFTLINSYSHDANVGHAVKTRAENNYILYNRIFEGKASYAIDISIGGKTFVMGNIIYQNSETQNSVLVSYGAEGLKYPNNNLIFVFNTLLNDRSNGVFLYPKKGAAVVVANNIFSGKGKAVIGKVLAKSNVSGAGIFRAFSAASVKINSKWIAQIKDRSATLVTSDGKTVVPEFQYVNGKLTKRIRTDNAEDIGAIEFD